jgi:hypothetical protein
MAQGPFSLRRERIHTQKHNVATHAQEINTSVSTRSHKNNSKTSARISLKLLEGVDAECWSDGVLLVCLGVEWRHLGVTFIAPRGLGAIAHSL